MRSNHLITGPAAQNDEANPPGEEDAPREESAPLHAVANSVPPPSSRRLRAMPKWMQGDPTLLRKLIAAFDASMDGLAILDGETFVYVNAEHARMYGYRPEELLGKTWRELYSPEQQAYIAQTALLEVMQKGHYRGEAKGKRKDGTLFDVELSFTYTEYGDLVCSCRDISERKRMEAEQAETQKRKSELSVQLLAHARAKDEFLAILSHELRTPLNTILGMAELLDESAGGALSVTQRGWLQSISTRGEHLLTVINSLLDLSKLLVGKMELRHESLNVADVCQGCLCAVRPVAKEKNIFLELTMDEGAMEVHADEKRLRQILMNLLSNALKFTHRDGSVGIWVAKGGSPGEVAITVWDTGIGIAPEDTQRLFLPFVQVSNGLSRQYQGTGLGLALVARLVELQGGSIRVDSERGRGSRFMVLLPGKAEGPKSAA